MSSGHDTGIQAQFCRSSESEGVTPRKNSLETVYNSCLSIACMNVLQKAKILEHHKLCVCTAQGQTLNKVHYTILFSNLSTFEIVQMDLRTFGVLSRATCYAHVVHERPCRKLHSCLFQISQSLHCDPWFACSYCIQLNESDTPQNKTKASLNDRLGIRSRLFAVPLHLT